MDSPGNKLFETNVGSHMWNMNHAESDVDIFHAYVTDTHRLLRGTADMRSDHVQEGIEDYAVHEIGHIINHRLKGNVNFMWGIHSPIVIKDEGGWLGMLKRISLDNLSKNSYHSIKGLAMNNMKKYILVKETPPDVRQKKSRIIARTLLMGITLLSLGKIRFDPIRINTDKDGIEFFIKELDDAYESSSLPEAPDEEPFRDYLEQIRWETLFDD